ncbi:MAG: trigger factor [Neisseriales bacterium]|nr:MAG: trigger factor [Neisseriales bacterium]
MQVKLDKLANLQHKMHIAIPAPVIEQKIAERLKHLSVRTKIAGFRPGKAPLSIIAANYGQSIRREVIGELVNSSFEQALSDHNLQIVGVPEFELSDQPTDGNVFSFKAIFEVYPEVLIQDLFTKTVNKPTTVVTNEDIDQTVLMLRKQHVQFNLIKRAACSGDRITIDFEGTLSKKPFEGGKAADFVLILGQGRLLPAFEKSIIGMQVGETNTVKVPFPKDYHSPTLAGKTAEFVITVKKIEEPSLPNLDTTFAKKLGIVDGDVDKLLVAVRSNIEKEVDRRLYFKTRENVMNMLLEAVPIKLPLCLVEKEIQRLVEDTEKRLSQSDKGVKSLPRQIFQKNAERNVALNIIFSQIIQSQQLTAKPEDIKTTVDHIADTYEDPKKIIDWYYADKNRLASAAKIALEETVIKWVLQQVKLVEQPVTFAEIMEIQPIKSISKPSSAKRKNVKSPQINKKSDV